MKINLNADKREILGRKVKALRKEGKIPANVFGKKIKSESLVVDKKEFIEVFKHAGETQIIDLGGRPVLVSNVQINPLTEEFLHIDFRQVDLNEEIKAKVPVVIEGESPAEKQNLGAVVAQIDEIEVEALPTDLPEKIVVDISNLAEVDQAIYVKDLKVGSSVRVLNDGELIVVKVEPPQKEEVVEAPVTETAEGAETKSEGDNKAETTESPKEENK